jgi:hypothetical protein
MRFTRLKKYIEASVSNSAPSSQPTNGKEETTSQGGPKNKTKKRKIDKQTPFTGSKLGGNQIDKDEAEVGIETESAGQEIVFPSAPVKRQTRGKKIDVSAAFESDSSPSSGARNRHEDDTSDYEDCQVVAQEDDEIFGLNSENEHPAKRRRGVALRKILSRTDYKRNSVVNNLSQPSGPDAWKQPTATSAKIPTALRGVSQIQLDTPSTPNRAVHLDQTTITSQSPSSLTTLRSPTPQLTSSISIPPPPCSSAYPTPPDTRFINSGATNLNFNDASAADIMPSIEYDDDNDGSLESNFDPTAAVAGSNTDEESETRRNGCTIPAKSPPFQ